MKGPPHVASDAFFIRSERLVRPETRCRNAGGARGGLARRLRSREAPEATFDAFYKMKNTKNANPCGDLATLWPAEVARAPPECATLDRWRTA